MKPTSNQVKEWLNGISLYSDGHYTCSEIACSFCDRHFPKDNPLTGYPVLSCVESKLAYYSKKYPAEFMERFL